MNLNLLLLSLLLLPTLLACSEGESEVTIPPPPVAATPVVGKTLAEVIAAPGQLVAKERAKVASQVAGTVTEILVDEGSAADAGAVVLTIDPERRELDLASANARLAETRAALAEQKREYDRMRELHERNVAAQSRVDQSRTQYELAMARVDAARAQQGSAERALADATVRAPFAGLVGNRLVSVGEFVQPGEPLFELVALDPVEIEFHLPEVDSARVSVGLEVAVSVAPWPDEKFPARVTMISPTIDERSRTLRVKAELANPEGRLRPGLFARAILGISQREGVLMVPEEAILRRADGAIVFEIEGDRVTRVPVQTGSFKDGWVEVRSDMVGLGDRVVRRGHDKLTNGMRVSVRTEDGLLPTPKVATGPDAGAPTDGEDEL